MSNILWQRYCKYLKVYPELNFTLDISRMRFADNFFEKTKVAAEKAIVEMKKLESGALANPDEQRMVGHYWLRNSSLAPSNDLKVAIEKEIKKIKDFAEKIHSGTIKTPGNELYENLVIIGIGGSALGPQLVSDCLGTTKDKIKTYFCDNTDPDGIQRIIEILGKNLAQTLLLAISKSGGTLETRNGELEFHAAYKKLGLNFAKHIVAVTCEGSKLDLQAKKEGWLENFYLWDWVGGRTSLFSAVGLLPAALQGLDLDAFLAGAKEMDQLTRTKPREDNPAMLLALMWYFAGEGKGKKDMVILPYKDRLVLFSKYLQQLVMESIGKEKDLNGEIVNQGIAVYGNKGSTDQHAYVQQLRDGLNNFFATFIQILSDYTCPPASAPLEVDPNVTSGDYLQGFFLGTRKALYENNRDSITIAFEQLTPKTLGALIALYERAVSFYATLVNINAYHQPGVEAGKKAAAQVIDIKKKILTCKEFANSKESALSAEGIANKINCAEEVETVFKILEHLSANKYAKVSRIGNANVAEIKFYFV